MIPAPAPGLVEGTPVSAAPPALALVRLLQWSSPTLPVGGFSYAQGLEQAVAAGLVRDETTAAEWIATVLEGPVGGVEAGFLAAYLEGWRTGQPDHLARLDAVYLASREGAQLLAETRQMGWSLLQLVNNLAVTTDLPLQVPCAQLEAWRSAGREPSYLLVWAALAVASAVADQDAVQAWLWSWTENQVMAALKTVPLGQAAGQRLLFRLASGIPALAAAALQDARHAGEPGWLPGWNTHHSGTLGPGFAWACAAHETLYSRLFRS